jgi:hypothetical protein
MCYFLYIASPLTLSEVRSMLPAGLSADLLPPTEQAALRDLHPEAQTVARILHGGCSCDLVTQRHPASAEDEARLRIRYRAMGYSRAQVIRALEVHRRAVERRPKPPGYWPQRIVEFVWEHARNAGPTLYYLQFSHEGLQQVAPGPPRIISTADVRAFPGIWLPEDAPIVVVRNDAP